MQNINDTILLVAAIQGFLLALGLATKKTKNRISNISVSVVVFVVALTLLFSWGGATGYNNSINAVPYWLLISFLLIPASLWLFFESNTNPTFRFRKKYLLAFLPAFLEILIQITIQAFPQLLGIRVFALIIHSKPWFFFIEILPLLSSVFILIFYLRRIWITRQKFGKLNTRGHSTYLRNIFFIMLLMSMLLIIWTASAFYFVQYKFVEIALVTYVFALGYIAYFKPDFFEVPKLIIKTTANFINYDDKAELNRLRSLFIEKYAHRKPKLAVKDVADELNLPVKYISYLIGHYHSQNFNDYVNSFRVQEIIARMADPTEKNKSLLGIALDSGFNSKSSFNQVFKHHTGKTPSEYLFL